MNPSFDDIITPEIWDNSDDDFDSDEYEEKQLQHKIDIENEKAIEEYNECNNLINAICKDMKDKDPQINDNLRKLMDRLQRSSEKVNQQGGRKKDGTRLSELQNRVTTTQGNYTKAQIQERLLKFTKVKIPELFEIPNGVWIRYFNKNDDGKKGLYRTGGFMIHKDPEKRYITLMAHHNDKTPQKQSFTWNMQIANVYSVYVTTKHVKTFRMQQIDKKFNLLKGTTNMLNKWMNYNPIYEKLANANNKSVVFVIYDILSNTLHTPNKTYKTSLKLIESIDITLSEFKKQYSKGLKEQLKKPMDGMFLVGLIKKEDVDKLKKMKSRLKVF